MNRRDAVCLMGGAVSLGLAAVSRSVSAAERARTCLGIVIYALNNRRRVIKTENPKDDLFAPLAFLDTCHRLGAGGIQLPLGTMNPQACDRFRAKAAAAGMFIEGIAHLPHDGDLQRFEAEIGTAARVGARCVRTVVLPGRRYEQFTSLDEFRACTERGKRALEQAVPIVERHQVPLAIENHKDQRVDELLALLQHLGSPYIGACVDTGNSFALVEDPMAVVEALAPYAISVHLKDQAVGEYEEGFLLADVALGEGFLDLKAMVRLLRGARPEVQFSLETITRDPLRVPCLTEGYWRTLPEVPASDLARTLRTVRTHASPELPQVGSLSLGEQAEVEWANVRRCLDYARTNLGLVG